MIFQKTKTFISKPTKFSINIFQTFLTLVMRVVYNGAFSYPTKTIFGTNFFHDIFTNRQTNKFVIQNK